MQRSLYQVLEIPSSATRAEIRAAYRRQLSRIRIGELSSSLRPLIERACVTLDDPDRRIHYDVTIAGNSNFHSVDREDGGRTSSQFVTNLVTSGAALVAALAIIVLAASVMRSRRGPLLARPVPGPAPASLAIEPAPVAEPAQPQDRTLPGVSATEPAAPIAAAPAAPQDAEPVAAQDAAPAPPLSIAPVPAIAARLAPFSGTVARPPAASTLTGSAGPGQAASVDPPQALSPDTASAPSIVVGADSPSSAPALVQSSPFGRAQQNGNTRADYHVQGWFCRDTSGGEVFVSVGAPLPAGVSCQ